MLSLFNVAFQSRYSLFLIIGAGCMVFGLHLQIELEVGGGVHHEQHGVEHNLDQHRENDVDERIDNSRNINS